VNGDSTIANNEVYRLQRFHKSSNKSLSVYAAEGDWCFLIPIHVWRLSIHDSRLTT